MKTEQELLNLARQYGWKYISVNEELSESFMEKYWVFVDKNLISINQKLSEPFIGKYWNVLDKYNISVCQKLSESFMERYWDDLDKDLIFKYQRLSKPFIEKHWDDLKNYFPSGNQESYTAEQPPVANPEICKVCGGVGEVLGLCCRCKVCGSIIWGI